MTECAPRTRASGWFPRTARREPGDLGSVLLDTSESHKKAVKNYDFLTELLALRYAVFGNSEEVRRSGPTENVVLAVGAAVASTAVLAWTPPFVSFGLAVIAAICWCLWLERPPTT